MPAVDGVYFEVYQLLELDRTLRILRNSSIDLGELGAGVSDLSCPGYDQDHRHRLLLLLCGSLNRFVERHAVLKAEDDLSTWIEYRGSTLFRKERDRLWRFAAGIAVGLSPGVHLEYEGSKPSSDSSLVTAREDLHPPMVPSWRAHR